MSVAILLPNLTTGHDAAVRGLPEDVADKMLEWASDLSATVPQMLAWGRVTFPETEAPSTEATETHQKPKRRVRQRAKPNDVEADRPRQESGTALTPEELPRGALTTDTLTVRMTSAECIFAATAIRGWIVGTPQSYPRQCPPDTRHEAERLASLLTLHGRGSVAVVTLAREDWTGRRNDRARRPGVVGLLYAANVNGPAGWLGWAILRRIEGVL